MIAESLRQIAHLVQGMRAAGVEPVEDLSGAIWGRVGGGDDLLDFVEGHIPEIGVRVPEIGARRWGIRHYFVNVVHSVNILVEMAGWGQAEQFILYHWLSFGRDLCFAGGERETGRYSSRLYVLNLLFLI